MPRSSLSGLQVAFSYIHLMTINRNGEQIMKSMIYPGDANEYDFCAIGEDTLDDLKFPVAIDGIAAYISKNEKTIQYRQELFENMLAFPELFDFFTDIYAGLSDLKEIALKNPESLALGNEQLLYSMRELCVFTDLVNRIAEKYDGMKSHVTAKGFEIFFGYVKSIKESENFDNICEKLKLVDDGMKSIKSITLGINLTSQLSASEVGIISINSQPYVSDTPLDKLLRKENPDREFRCIAPLGLVETGGVMQRNAMSIDVTFYNAMNNILKGSIKNLKHYFTNTIFTTITTMLNYLPEINFLIRAGGFMLTLQKKNIKLSFPTISEKHEADNLINPNLIEKMPLHKIIPNDSVFDDDGRVFILTGPNSGGKSVFVQAVGIAQIMFQLGLPVTADRASYSICDAVYTHFNKTSANTIESRLVNETKRLKQIMNQTTENTLLLFDEMLSSTSAYDATILASGILKHISKIGCKCIYATHLHELAMNYQSLNEGGANKGKIDVLCSPMKNGLRSYEIKRGKIDSISSSFAKDIFIEYGIDFIFEQEQ
jgi:Mismatch repair ATPase (MutS family)